MADLSAARARQTCWDDPALLKQLQLGNEAALTQVYRRLERPLYRFAYAMTGSPAIAEEAVQETFLRLIRQPGGLPCSCCGRESTKSGRSSTANL